MFLYREGNSSDAMLTRVTTLPLMFTRTIWLEMTLAALTMRKLCHTHQETFLSTSKYMTTS
jgi:hypothetical protein